MWPVPASGMVILGAAGTSGLHGTALFLCSVGDASRGTRWRAWPSAS